jgi:SnoaL-like domain
MLKSPLKLFLQLIICFVFLDGCRETTANVSDSKKEINSLLDSFNIAAANADFNKYFNYFADDAVFIGTDATENWDKKSFMVWAKPHFDHKKTWNFKSLGRNIYLDAAGRFAWFDEILNTQMKLCRGSGVLEKNGEEWKLKQYVLSITIPNNQVDSIVKIKSLIEDEIISQYSRK